MKNIILLLLFLLTAQFASSQNDTIVYYKKNSPYPSKSGADKQIEVQEKNKNLSIMITSSFKDGKWNVDKTERIKLKKNGKYWVRNGGKTFRRSFNKVEGGFQIQDYTKSGKLKSFGMSQTLFPLSYIGIWTYFDNGKTIRIDVYKDKKLTESYFTIKSNIYPTNTYANADSLASYRGGMERYDKDLTQNTRYPIICRENGYFGKVLVFFCIDIDGTVGELQILSDTRKDLNRAAMLAVVLSNSWNPAIKDGKPVKVYSIVPVNFQLR